MSKDPGLSHMDLFVEVARTANFTRAGANLGIPTPTVSRTIAAMERSFGLRLFNRTTRRVELTDAGRRYFERCAPLVDAARIAVEALLDTGTRPTGNIRLSMPVDFGVHIAAPVLADFAKLHPGISLDLDLSPRHTDLVGEHVDVAIRFGTVLEDQLIARRIGWIERALFAAPAYLELRRPPQQPTDLVEHECIILGALRTAQWKLSAGSERIEVAVGGRFVTNNHGLACELAERGLGIAVLTPALVRGSVRAGRLKPVLSEWSLPRMPINAVTTSRLQPAAVKALVEFLVNRLNSL